MTKNCRAFALIMFLGYSKAQSCPRLEAECATATISYPVSVSPFTCTSGLGTETINNFAMPPSHVGLANKIVYQSGTWS